MRSFLRAILFAICYAVSFEAFKMFMLVPLVAGVGVLLTAALITLLGCVVFVIRQRRQPGRVKTVIGVIEGGLAGALVSGFIGAPIGIWVSIGLGIYRATRRAEAPIPV